MSNSDGRNVAFLPGIARIHPPNGIRTPLKGGDAGPLTLDPNAVPRPPIKPEDIPPPAASRTPESPMQVQQTSPVTQPVSPLPQAALPTPWWLDPNLAYSEDMAKVPQALILFLLGQLHMGRLPNATRETIVQYYLDQGLQAAVAGACQEYDTYSMSVATQAAVQVGQAQTPMAPVQQLAAASAPSQQPSQPQQQPQSVVQAPQGPPQLIPVAAPEPPKVVRVRMTAALRKEAEDAFARGESVEAVAKALKLPYDRVDQAHVDWRKANKALQDPNASFESLPPVSTFCAACFEENKRYEQQRMSRGGLTCRYGHGGAPSLVAPGSTEVVRALDAPMDDSFLGLDSLKNEPIDALVDDDYLDPPPMRTFERAAAQDTKAASPESEMYSALVVYTAMLAAASMGDQPTAEVVGFIRRVNALSSQDLERVVTLLERVSGRTDR